jgi:beta-lactam-binding protein with PASTA domain
MQPNDHPHDRRGRREAPGSRRAIPPVYDMTVAEAAAVLREAGFRPVALRRRFGSADMAALVRGTVPAEGVAVQVGGRVDLLPVRAGADEGPSPEKRAFKQGLMADFTDWPIEEAFPVLPLGVHSEVRRGYSIDFDYDRVISTDPRASTPFASDFVRFWVSDGPPPPVDPPEPPPDFIPFRIPDDFVEHSS